MDVEWAEISDLGPDERERACAYVRVYTYYLASAFIPMVTRDQKKKRRTSDKHSKPIARWQVALAVTQLDAECVFFFFFHSANN